MIDVVNLQRKFKIDAGVFREFTRTLSETVEEANQRPFSVAFVADSRMKELNNFFRGKDSTTDVLSFPREPDEFEPENDALGDIVVSVEQASRQSAENGLTLEIEIKQLILHGLLHLCGYDHETDEGEMNSRELELRQRLAIAG